MTVLLTLTLMLMMMMTHRGLQRHDEGDAAAGGDADADSPHHADASPTRRRCRGSALSWRRTPPRQDDERDRAWPLLPQRTEAAHRVRSSCAETQHWHHPLLHIVIIMLIIIVMPISVIIMVLSPESTASIVMLHDRPLSERRPLSSPSAPPAHDGR